MKVVSLNFEVNIGPFKLHDNNLILISNKIKFFLYYSNYLVVNTQTQEFNLDNSNILDFGTYSTWTNKMSQQQPIRTVLL